MNKILWFVAKLVIALVVTLLGMFAMTLLFGFAGVVNMVIFHSTAKTVTTSLLWALGIFGVLNTPIFYLTKAGILEERKGAMILALLTFIAFLLPSTF